MIFVASPEKATSKYLCLRILKKVTVQKFCFATISESLNSGDDAQVICNSDTGLAVFSLCQVEVFFSTSW